MEKWKMFRVWLDHSGQKIFVNRLIKNPPSFPFTCNKYTNMPAERDHVQFRFPESQLENAIAYMKQDPNEVYQYDVYDWNEHPSTIINMQIATECALIFIRRTSATRVVPYVMTEFLHYFLNILDYGYFDEEEIGLLMVSFWRNRRQLKKEYGNPP